MSTVAWSPQLKNIVSQLKSLESHKVESALTDTRSLSATETKLLQETFLKPSGPNKVTVMNYWW